MYLDIENNCFLLSWSRGRQVDFSELFIPSPSFLFLSVVMGPSSSFSLPFLPPPWPVTLLPLGIQLITRLAW